MRRGMNFINCDDQISFLLLHLTNPSLQRRTNSWDKVRTVMSLLNVTEQRTHKHLKTFGQEEVNEIEGQSRHKKKTSLKIVDQFKL